MDFWPNGGTSPQPGTEYDWIPDYNSHMRATVSLNEGLIRGPDLTKLKDVLMLYNL